jgi:hypothetical protein
VREAAARGASVLVTCQMRSGWPPEAQLHLCKSGQVHEGEWHVEEAP